MLLKTNAEFNDLSDKLKILLDEHYNNIKEGMDDVDIEIRKMFALNVLSILMYEYMANKYELNYGSQLNHLINYLLKALSGVIQSFLLCNSGSEDKKNIIDTLNFFRSDLFEKIGDLIPSDKLKH